MSVCDGMSVWTRLCAFVAWDCLDVLTCCLTTCGVLALPVSAPLHRGPEVCLPDGGEAVPGAGVSAGRRAFHAAGERRNHHGGCSQVSPPAAVASLVITYNYKLWVITYSYKALSDNIQLQALSDYIQLQALGDNIHLVTSSEWLRTNSVWLHASSE